MYSLYILGMTFHMVSKVPPVERPLQLRPLGWLWRPSNYNYTAADFRAYEENRAWYLRHPRIARAALQRGGIVWRLAVEHLEPDLLLNRFDDDSPLFSANFRVIHSNGNVEGSEHLDSEELGFIIGEYRSNTRQDNQEACPSWWPRDHAWKRSALHCGYWSPMDEQWYQETKASYLAGTAQPRRAGKWSKYLLHWNRRVICANRRIKAASEYVLQDAPLA